MCCRFNLNYYIVQLPRVLLLLPLRLMLRLLLLLLLLLPLAVIFFRCI